MKNPTAPWKTSIFWHENPYVNYIMDQNFLNVCSILFALILLVIINVFAKSETVFFISLFWTLFAATEYISNRRLLKVFLALDKRRQDLGL
jgi:hypothetical protein